MIPNWRGPQHEDDWSIGADDGSRWIAPVPGADADSPGACWTRWEPGEDGIWLIDPSDAAAEVPREVLQEHVQLTRERNPVSDLYQTE